MPDAKFRDPSEHNAAVAARSHYPPRPGEAVDWSCRLFDTDGYEHVLIDLGAQQLVTKLSFSYAVWERRTGRCLSYSGEIAIRNAPLTDVERHQKHMDALQALRTMFPEGDPRREELEQRSVMRER